MTTANKSLQNEKAVNNNGKEYENLTRRRVMGIIFLLSAAVIWAVFVRDLDPNILTTFNMSPGGAVVDVADWIFKPYPVMSVLAFICAALGAYQLARGFGKRTNLILGLVAAMFVFAFLSWAAAGKSMNMVGLIKTSLIKAVPLTLGALSGILCERSGVVNIGIEGMMLVGAFVGGSGGQSDQYLGWNVCRGCLWRLIGAVPCGAFYQV